TYTSSGHLACQPASGPVFTCFGTIAPQRPEVFVVSVPQNSVGSTTTDTATANTGTPRIPELDAAQANLATTWATFVGRTFGKPLASASGLCWPYVAAVSLVTGFDSPLRGSERLPSKHPTCVASVLTRFAAQDARPGGNNRASQQNSLLPTLA